MTRARLLQLITAADDEKWREAVARLQQLGARFYRATEWQLKIGTTNYYPKTGTIFIDGDTRPLPTNGLEALIRLLSGGGASTPSQTQTRHDPQN